ncbi:hypothetical protein NDN08_004881 [Rhodosorus marinus]|uniref:Uncharacterized protein n=1 Tax=Rhodosorus marinus TaxID=101924 RepID=A0AAV8UEY5_9RHOD|nr:hypothetical protein NDN08_004881 [Rhodosorus marinus]
MVKVVTLAVLSLTLLGVVSCSPTCGEVRLFKRFSCNLFTGDLVDEDGTLLGGIALSVVPKVDTNCFRVEFTTLENIGLLKLRAGVFSSADESAPTGKDRFTRRREVSRITDPTQRRSARMDICPSSISVEQSESCCGESFFDLYAYAVVNLDGMAVRAYMKQQVDSTLPCKAPDPKKPFREVCTLEVSCSSCNADECLLSQQCIPLHEWTKNCANDSTGKAHTRTQHCTCEKLVCGSEMNCIDDHACTAVTTFAESCSTHWV